MTIIDLTDLSDAMHTCDVCFANGSGFQTKDEAEMDAHMRDVHNIAEPHTLARIALKDGFLVMQEGRELTMVDLEQWLVWQMSGCSPDIFDGGYHIDLGADDGHQHD